MISLTGAKLVSRQFLDPCCRLSTRVTHALVSSFFLLLASRVWRICKDHLYPFWNEWALNIVGCRPQSRFKWWSSTTRFKKPSPVSVLQLRNQSWNRCHHAEKQTLQGRHTLDELFLLISKGTFRHRIQFSNSYKQNPMRPTQVQWTRNKLSRITESLPRPNAEHQPNFAK